MTGVVVSCQSFPVFEHYFGAKENSNSRPKEHSSDHHLLESLLRGDSSHDNDSSDDGAEKVSKSSFKFFKSNKSLNYAINEAQELLKSERVLSMEWKNYKTCSIVLTNGTIIQFCFIEPNKFSCSVDNSFKMNEVLMDVTYTSKIVLYLLHDNRLLMARKDEAIAENRRMNFPEDVESDKEITIFNDFLPNFGSRKKQKQICLKETSDLFVVWWSSSKSDVFPWSPRPEQRANILFYLIPENTNSHPELFGYLKTDCKLLEVGFLPDSNKIYTLEQTLENGGNVVLKETIREFIGRQSIVDCCETVIPLQSELRCWAYDASKTKLAVGCCDSSLTVYNQCGKITRFTSTSFIPSEVSWLKFGYLVFVVGDLGQYQIFDIALNPLLLTDCQSELVSVIKQIEPNLVVAKAAWRPIKSTVPSSAILLCFESGGFKLLNFSIGHVDLIKICELHLIGDHHSNAVKILQCVEWNSDICLHTFYLIFGYLIKQKPSDDIEYSLEQLFATFYIPPVPIPENMKSRHSSKIQVAARRYFMWLLRFGKYPRALQIALSLKENGLLYKLQCVASANGDHVTAAECASEILPRVIYNEDLLDCSSSYSSCSSSCSTCGSHSGSESYSGSSDNSCHSYSCHETCSSENSGTDEISSEDDADGLVPTTSVSNLTLRTSHAREVGGTRNINSELPGPSHPSSSNNTPAQAKDKNITDTFQIVELGNV